jgi:hypothetical protein
MIRLRGDVPEWLWSGLQMCAPPFQLVRSRVGKALIVQRLFAFWAHALARTGTERNKAAQRFG